VVLAGAIANGNTVSSYWMNFSSKAGFCLNQQNYIANMGQLRGDVGKNGNMLWGPCRVKALFASGACSMLSVSHEKITEPGSFSC